MFQQLGGCVFVLIASFTVIAISTGKSRAGCAKPLPILLRGLEPLFIIRE
jgi:hypothetical protein